MNIIQYDNITQVVISPIRYKFNDTVDSTIFCLRGIGDTFFDNATFYWELRSNDQVIQACSNLTISGSNYSSWDKSIESAFTICANILSITLTNEIITLPE